MSLLEALIIVSEKAANIARLCRREKHLFELLVQEKGTLESNPRFVQDFKTLADVLIQETVIHDIGNQFPEIKKHIKGEENNTFCNTLGDSVCVQIQNDPKQTASLLEVVLNGDKSASKLLAEEVHRNILVETIPTCAKLDKIPTNNSELGIWIDPIDSTAEYISGKEVRNENGIFVNGLRCVTVLIGVFSKTTGTPLIGIVNQPFFEQVDNEWRGRCHWGIKSATCGDPNVSCCVNSNITSSKLICLSSSEDEVIKNKLISNGFHLVEAAGAGYKILSVITGQVDAYVLSKSSTFRWDTCGPQAILQSLGGDVLKFDDALNNSYASLRYDEDVDEKEEEKVVRYCNFGGIIAFRDKKTCDEIIKALNV